MTREDLISLVEDFNEWLENMAVKYNWDKDEIQYLIKQFLK